MENGRLEKVKAFSFEYLQMNRHVIRDVNVEIVKEFDANGRMADVHYKFNNVIVFTLQITYDNMNRVHRWRRRISETDTKAYEYKYDLDSNIISVLLEGQAAFAYEYDASSNLKATTNYGKRREMIINIRDQIHSYGDVTYKFDKDGFLVQRNEELFQYDSQGQLVHASEPGRYELYYFYDGRGRLVARKDVVSGYIMQYFYADINRDDQITHIFNHQTREISMLYYDPDGKFFAMERNSSFYYIAFDTVGSPITIFNSVGTIMKKMSYSPLGAMETDTNPRFEFAFGFQGALYDPVTRLLSFDGRLYDPAVGRYTSPDLNTLFEKLNLITYNPEKMNLYQNKDLINIHQRVDKYMLGK